MVHNILLHFLRIPLITHSRCYRFDEQGGERWIKEVKVTPKCKSAMGDNEGR